MRTIKPFQAAKAGQAAPFRFRIGLAEPQAGIAREQASERVSCLHPREWRAGADVSAAAEGEMA